MIENYIKNLQINFSIIEIYYQVLQPTGSRRSLQQLPISPQKLDRHVELRNLVLTKKNNCYRIFEFYAKERDKRIICENNLVEEIKSINNKFK